VTLVVTLALLAELLVACDEDAEPAMPIEPDAVLVLAVCELAAEPVMATEPAPESVFGF
jgi:hypothetical protein